MQTPFLSASDLNDPALVPYAIDALREIFPALLNSKLEMPERTLLTTADGLQQRQMLVSPIAWPDANIASVKITTLTPTNRDRGLQLIQGLVILMDLVNGRPQIIIDGGALTALRTGAVVGLAADLLSPPFAHRLSVIGTGIQARSVIDAILTVRPIEQINLASRTRTGAEVLAAWIYERWGKNITVHVQDSVELAVTNTDIICTATSTDSTIPIVKADWGGNAAFYAVIGGINEDACEVEPVLFESAIAVVETREGALAEAGEIRAAIKANHLNPDDLIELGTVVDNPSAFNKAHQKVIFRSVGNAAEDLAVAYSLLHKIEIT
ncbi:MULTISPECIES: ornithine cyclodeaminase family protein [Calothrix]|nr:MULTISPECIES: ornithine cyclodeaminase family protein [Calothrix]